MLYCTTQVYGIWYKKEMHELSQLDVIFFTRLCNIPTTSPGESYFLELGALNNETIIKARRIIYYHNIINRNQSQLVSSFFMLQYSKRVKGDWIIQTEKDFEDFGIHYNFEYLKSTSQNAF